MLQGQGGMSAILSNMKINSKDELYISIYGFGYKGNLLKYDLDGNFLWSNALSPATMTSTDV
ncbi:MAG: hypothetical protein U5K00_01695 [Melioribacteraceae bacterium]|nr:hypothetical protein [Melioribacteraceae bacterium]